jgi:hypothetical protein
MAEIMAARMLGRLVLPTISSSAKRNAIPRHLGWMALGMVSSPAALALCESGNGNNNNTPGIWDTVFPKDGNGKVHWDKASKQVTEAVFWDKLANATGKKVRLTVCCHLHQFHDVLYPRTLLMKSLFSFKARWTLVFLQLFPTALYQASVREWR